MGDTLNRKILAEFHKARSTTPQQGYGPQAQMEAIMTALSAYAEAIHELDSRLEAIESTHPERLDRLDTLYSSLNSAALELVAFKHKVEQMLDSIRKAMNGPQL